MYREQYRRGMGFLSYRDGWSSGGGDGEMSYHYGR